jgi:CRP/FNR family cyclic AMP-dependent transcriptional regulator
MSVTGRESPHTGGSRFFQQLSRDVTFHLLRGAVECRYAAGEILNSFEASLTLVGVLHEGVVRNYLAASNGREHAVGYLGPDDLLGAWHLLGGAPRLASQCLTTVHLVRLSPAVVRQVMADDAGVALAVGRELARDHRVATAELEVAAFASMKQRVAHQLFVRAQAQGNVLLVSQRDLALCVGSVREVVGRALGELEAVHAVRRMTGGELAVDPERLRAFLVGRRSEGGA